MSRLYYPVVTTVWTVSAYVPPIHLSRKQKWYNFRLPGLVLHRLVVQTVVRDTTITFFVILSRLIP